MLSIDGAYFQLVFNQTACACTRTRASAPHVRVHRALTGFCVVRAFSFLSGGFSLRRVLLRVRMLYYLKQEVIGDEAQNVLNNVDAR